MSPNSALLNFFFIELKRTNIVVIFIEKKISYRVLNKMTVDWCNHNIHVIIWNVKKKLLSSTTYSMCVDFLSITKVSSIHNNYEISI